MKTLLKISLFVLFPLIVFPQTLYTSTISATDSLGTYIRIGEGEYITNMTTVDSLTGSADSLADASKTVEFFVKFAKDTTGLWKDSTVALLQSDGWALISDYNNGTTIYDPILVKNVNTPLQFQQMAHYIGSSTTRGSNQLFIIPYFTTAVGTDATIKFYTIKINQ